ncbi:hypothetical protein V8G54_031844 [Vigna mungo]|uniref:Uncharacterized protein n=1 Tax=Vigna mungo TaxID=3915 RepID=A0AAQ3RG59_VIGMU
MAETMLGSTSIPNFTILINIWIASSSSPFCVKATSITVKETSSSSSANSKICHAASKLPHLEYKSIKALSMHKSDCIPNFHSIPCILRPSDNACKPEQAMSALKYVKVLGLTGPQRI